MSRVAGVEKVTKRFSSISHDSMIWAKLQGGIKDSLPDFWAWASVLQMFSLSLSPALKVWNHSYRSFLSFAPYVKMGQKSKKLSCSFLQWEVFAFLSISTELKYLLSSVLLNFCSQQTLQMLVWSRSYAFYPASVMLLSASCSTFKEP